MNKITVLAATLFLMLSVTACSLTDDPNADDSDLIAETLLPDPGTLPGADATAYDKVELGRLLFWDPILSGEKDVSCATCHHPDFGYADGRDLSLGVGAVGLGPNRRDASGGAIPVVGRNAPTVINTVFNGTTRNGTVPQSQAPMFWDNRARSLETQALGPPLSFEEMRGHAYEANVALDSIELRLQANREYRQLFREVYGGGNSNITAENVADAIAAFERTIVADNSPFDRFQSGNQNAISAAARRGFERFNAVGCGTCHQGPMFSDYLPHTLGVPENDQRETADGGVNNTFAFRTPTLRNITLTQPYFHNGTSRTLEDVMQFYLRAQNTGQGPGGQPTNPNVREVDPLLRNMTLQPGDVNDIIAFMESLEDNDFDKEIPGSVPSGLPVGGNIRNGRP